ncbi:MAG: hypothetical protein ACREUU_17380, partial [Gammaproteobacteria bacterium]
SHTSPASAIGWPADLVGGSFSLDRINIQDIAAFVSPLRRLNTDPGDANFDVRWDLVPGTVFGATINIQDMSSVSTVSPPMLGLERAFLGPTCRWPATDLDGDKVIDEFGCGGDPGIASKRPERLDGPFAGVDDDADTLIDEGLPAGSSIYDCDGDGYRGSVESHVFAPIIQRDQDSCGNNGWPADLLSTGFSANKVNIQDLSSFIAPVRILNTNPGDANFNVRWDLLPGTTLGKTINIQDMASVSILVPPMLGVRAFGGPACPWAP